MKPILDSNERGEYIHDIWRAWQRRLITWESVQPAQDAVMPRCEQCHAAPVIDSGTGLCAACYLAEREP